MMGKKIPRGAWLLLLNGVMLAATAITAVVKLEPAESAPGATEQAADIPVPHWPQRQTPISDIQRAPLFDSSRQPALDDTATASADAVALTEPPVLIGVLADGNLPRALLEDSSTNTRKLLQAGDVFAGWTLDSISGKKVVLHAAGRKAVLDLSMPRAISKDDSKIDMQAKTTQ